MTGNEKEDAVFQAAMALGVMATWVVKDAEISCFFVHAIDEAGAIKVAEAMSLGGQIKAPFTVERRS